MLEAPFYSGYGRVRLVLHKITSSKYFDLAISAVIGLNIITMAMEFYMMPTELARALKIFNYFFTGIFCMESGMKVAALGAERYRDDKWNQLDLGSVIQQGKTISISVAGIAVVSLVGIGLEEVEGVVFPISPTVLRVLRVLRIARVLKLLKAQLKQKRPLKRYLNLTDRARWLTAWCRLRVAFAPCWTQ